MRESLHLDRAATALPHSVGPAGHCQHLEVLAHSAPYLRSSVALSGGLSRELQALVSPTRSLLLKSRAQGLQCHSKSREGVAASTEQALYCSLQLKAQLHVVSVSTMYLHAKEQVCTPKAHKEF